MDSRSSGVIALPDGPQLQNAVGAANETSGPRTVPGRVIPVPASVSPAMQETIAMPYRDSEWRLDPPDAAGWRQAVAGLAAHTIPAIEKIRDQLGVQVEPVLRGQPRCRPMGTIVAIRCSLRSEAIFPVFHQQFCSLARGISF